MSENQFVEPPVPLIDRAIFLAKSLPWWAIILVMGLILVAYSMLANDERRDVMDYLIDRPSFQTDEYYDVTYEIDAEVLLVSESYLVIDAYNDRLTVFLQDLIAREEGVLECPTDAPADCLSQRGTVITYRQYDIPSGVEPSGTYPFEAAVLDQQDDMLTVRLANGDTLEIEAAWVTAEREGVLACNRVADSLCDSFEGRVVTFERPYILGQAIEVRGDAHIRYLEDGYERTIRPVFIKETREGVLSCDDDAPADCVEIPATYVTVPERITGVEIENKRDYVQVRVVAQETIEIERDRILDLNMGTVECDEDVDPRCQNFEGTLVNIKGEVVEGRLTLEDRTHYRIQPPGQKEAIRYRRSDIVEETRTPETCAATDQDPPCMIVIRFEETTLGGRIIEETDDMIVLETVPEKVFKIEKDDITKTSRRVPSACALNNLRACNEGIFLTLIVTFSAYTLALMIGLMVGVGRVMQNPIIFHLSTLYVELIRGIPLLVLLFVFAFVIGPEMRDGKLFGLDIPIVSDFISGFYKQLNSIEVRILGFESFLSEAILGLAVGYGAFLGEVFRAGIQSIHRGQMEASRSLGMSYFQSMRHIILPQAIRIVLPPLGNDFIALLKDSSLIMVLALPDMFFRGRSYASESFRYVDVYTGVALYYVAMTLLLSLIVRQIERWARLP